MSAWLGVDAPAPRRAALLAVVMLAMPPAAFAQDSGSASPAKTGVQDISDVDHSGMQGMDHAPIPRDADAMQGTQHAGVQDGDRSSVPGTGSMSGMTMGPMQGGRAPADARSADYSDGIVYGAMQGMEMLDNLPRGGLLIDQLEAFHGSDANGQTWEGEGWYGNDMDKLWVRSAGERSRGALAHADVEAFWNRNVAAFWSTQLGVRHDFGEGPARTWAAFGVQGISPYWFEIEATAYVGQSGRAAARLRAEYELSITQRLILQPEAEVDFYARDDRARRIGSGLSDAQLGLRLRYEFHRQFAPYIGVNWIRRIGTTADYVRASGESAFDRQVVAGIRIWF